MSSPARSSLAAPVGADAGAPQPALEAVADVARRLAGTAPLDAVMPDVLAVVCDALRARSCTLWLRDGDTLHPAARAGAPTPADEVVRARLLSQPTGAALPRLESADGLPLLVAPLVSDEQPLGAIVLGLDAAPGREAMLLAATLASLLSPAVAHTEQRRRLQGEVASWTQRIDEERRFTDLVVDALPTGLYVIDRDYRIQLWNRKRETGLAGVSRDDAIGRSIFEVLHRPPAELLRREFEEVFASGEVQHFSMESNATGDLRYYRVTKIPMRAGGNAVTHVITIVEDVTEWREAQERFAQAEKLAAIGQLAAGVMHEINNPLATIAACAESLTLALQDARAAGAPISAESDEYLRIVESEVHRSKRIVDRLLEFSRPKPLEPEPVDLNAVVEQTLFLLKHHSRFKRFTVVVDLADPPPVARGNAEQLVQVLMALLINAMDASAEPGPIAIRSHPGAGRADVMLEVRDQGHGIPRSELAKIFEPFYTTKAPGRGTGLGLSICYGIVAEHGGRIEVESAPGEGTTFRILLPAADA